MLTQSTSALAEVYPIPWWFTSFQVPRFGCQNHNFVIHVGKLIITITVAWCFTPICLLPFFHDAPLSSTTRHGAHENSALWLDNRPLPRGQLPKGSTNLRSWTQRYMALTEKWRIPPNVGFLQWGGSPSHNRLYIILSHGHSWLGWFGGTRGTPILENPPNDVWIWENWFSQLMDKKADPNFQTSLGISTTKNVRLNIGVTRILNEAWSGLRS